MSPMPATQNAAAILDTMSPAQTAYLLARATYDAATAEASLRLGHSPTLSAPDASARGLRCWETTCKANP